MSELKTCKYFTVSKFTQFPVNVKILLFFTTVYNVLRSNIPDTNKQFNSSEKFWMLINRLWDKKKLGI